MSIPEVESRARLIAFLKKFFQEKGSGGGSTSPGGDNTQIQYNDAGSFGGDANLTWSGSQLGVTGSVAINSGDYGVHVSGSGVNALLDVTCDDNAATTPSLYVTGSDVGFSTSTPKVHLDVNHGAIDWLSNDTGGGESVTFGGAGGVSLTVGKIYFLKNDGVWAETDADSKSTGGNQLLAIALGTNPSTDGMLVRGFFKASTAVSDWDEGKPVYLSTTAGLGTTTAPSATGDFVRIIGYCTATTDVIYFNPSSTYVEIS